MTREDFAASVWDRIVSRYLETPGLRDLCLELQELYDVDIVMALFLDAADRSDLSPSPKQIGFLQVSVAPWRSNVVKELRGVRQWLKPRVEDDRQAEFREKIKALELEAERFELQEISRYFNTMEINEPADASYSSARYYLETVNADPHRITQFCSP